MTLDERAEWLRGLKPHDFVEVTAHVYDKPAKRLCGHVISAGKRFLKIGFSVNGRTIQTRYLRRNGDESPRALGYTATYYTLEPMPKG